MASHCCLQHCVGFYINGGLAITVSEVCFNYCSRGSKLAVASSKTLFVRIVSMSGSDEWLRVSVLPKMFVGVRSARAKDTSWR